MAEDDWSAGTFDGAAAAQAARVAGLTPDQRMALLEDLLQVAADSGALQAAREAKQRAIDALWARG